MRAATRTTRFAKAADKAMMVNAGMARMRRDSRRWTMPRRSLREMRSEGRDVCGARACRGTRKLIFVRYANILVDIEAIPVENFVVNLADYERLSSVLWCILTRNAPAPVLLTAKTVIRKNGFELLQHMLIEYGKSASDHTTTGSTQDDLHRCDEECS